MADATISPQTKLRALIGTQTHCRNGHVGGTARISMAPLPRFPPNKILSSKPTDEHLLEPPQEEAPAFLL